MSRGPEVGRDEFEELRAQLAAQNGEPLYEKSRIAQAIRGSVRVNIPSEGRDLLGITKGTEVDVNIYRDAIVIRVPEEGDELDVEGNGNPDGPKLTADGGEVLCPYGSDTGDDR